MAKGIIIKALSGYYYVRDGATTYQCRGRGLFRKQKITPLVGDHVTYESTSLTDGTIVDIEERRNELVRPPIANVDQALLIFSVAEPDFDSKLLDRFLVSIESRLIQPIICLTKLDLLNESGKQQIKAWKDVYETIGYTVLLTSSRTEEGLKELLPFLENKTTVVAGQSGVGKSSLLNALNVNLSIETNEISESLGRGKHTTRHVELLPVGNGLVADTPGFSSLDFADIELEEIGACFPEIARFSASCKFRGCTHRSEPKCAVKEALESGEIASSRYENYLNIFEEVQNRKKRY
ncbi:ribosome small subunit-dependent GTPase A [Pullulanibacillus sp. KACC 23026]|uniref:ribosome small subunit-dependent GTPase A n=1 Tax=Pullulanibacillus sp. KACC 23026 TaxID=3028315 RepID=UPI0023AEBB4F|nr:ribosome small subunit-dependent GTPase A [Pullulanibacillus sp. KACC 23026]WEG11626.1 ribosome small subunit-dependent GTPase A [Pullulanibacillus sp. KACC 23026]